MLLRQEGTCEVLGDSSWRARALPLLLHRGVAICEYERDADLTLVDLVVLLPPARGETAGRSWSPAFGDLPRPRRRRSISSVAWFSVCSMAALVCSTRAALCWSSHPSAGWPSRPPRWRRTVPASRAPCSGPSWHSREHLPASTPTCWSLRRRDGCRPEPRWRIAQSELYFGEGSTCGGLRQAGALRRRQPQSPYPHHRHVPPRPKR